MPPPSKKRPITPPCCTTEPTEEVEVVEEDEEMLMTTTTTTVQRPTKRLKATTKDVVDETNNATIPSSTMNTCAQLKPHGILKLAQSVASTLASDFLRKREIRDLGVTCRWMLVSLNQCEIKEPIPLETLFHHNYRIQIWVGMKALDQTEKFRATIARIPNFFVGKFRCVLYQPSMVERRHLLSLGRLNDVHHLTLDLDSSIHEGDCPIPLPPRLQTLSFSSTCAGLQDFILPETLERIKFTSQGFNSRLTEVKWPGLLKELLNLGTRGCEGLRLPESIQTLTFHPDQRWPITNLTLPNSVTNLHISHWTKNGCYHDLVFPPSLQRLVLTVDYDVGDLDLTKWTGLPSLCQNIALIVSDREEEFDDEDDDDSDLSDVGTAPPPIVIPSFCHQLRVDRRSGDFRRVKAPMFTLDLSHATSLTSLLTDSIDAIQWPLNSTALVKLKVEDPSDTDFFSSYDRWLWYHLMEHPSLISLFPSTLHELDLLDTIIPHSPDLWADPFLPFQSGAPNAIIFPTSLRLLKLPRVSANVTYHPDGITACPNVLSWSESLPDCTIEVRCSHTTVYKDLNVTMPEPLTRVVDTHCRTVASCSIAYIRAAVIYSTC